MLNESTSKIKIPTLLGILFLVMGIVVGVFMVQSRQIFRSRANSPPKPKDVTITNITDTSFTVSWLTTEESTGFVAWGESEDQLSNRTEQGTSSLMKSVDVQNLKPKTSYYFQIFVNDKPNDNETKPWQVRTSTQLPPPATPFIASGTILNPDTTASAGAIVYLEVDGSSPRSTLTSANGRWIIPISELRNSSLDSYINLNNASTVIQIRAVDGKLVGTAKLRPDQLNPAPDIILGESYDFLQQTSNGESFQNPEAIVKLDQDELPTTNVDKQEDLTPTIVPEELMVEINSIENNEIIEEVLPEISGVGTPNLEIVITIESDPISETIVINEDGSWNWLPPIKLEDGLHTLTVSFIDSSGILQTIKKQFVVKASGSDLQSLTTTPTPTTLITPSTKPSIVPTISPEVKPQLPQTGIVQNTILLVSISIISIVFTLIFGYFALKLD